MWKGEDYEYKKVLTLICLSFFGLFILTSCGKTATTEHTHEYESTYSKNEEGHWYQAICEHTDEKKDFAAHTYGDFIVVKEATEAEAGSKKQVCSVCGYEHFEEIPKLIHGFVDGVCPNCGLRYVSEGLSYTLLEDGTYAVGLGECAEKYVYLPNEYNGIPVTKVEDDGFFESDIEGVLMKPKPHTHLFICE